MDRDVIATGKTIDEAIENGCAKLGVSADNVTYELIDLPKKKFFGLKTIPAKVKVTLTEEYANKFCVEEKKAEAPKCAAPKCEQAKPDKKDKKPQPKKQEQKPQQKKAEPKSAENTAAEEAPAAEAPAKREPKEIPQEVLDKKGGEAAAYVKEVIGALGFPDAEVNYSQKDGMIVLELCGENLGAVVGRRGDNLDAMQYLASLVANKSEGSYVRVVLDLDDYRSKREASLRAYARKIAFQAVKTQRSITLEAMNPYERRIVHSAVQTVNGATSKSIGSEPNRRVVISPVEGARFQRGDRKRSDGNRRNNNGRPYHRDDAQKNYVPTVPTANEIPKNDTSAISLYGRIDLD